MSSETIYSYVGFAFDIIGGIVKGIAGVLTDNGIIELAKGIKTLTGMWK
ncbi:hypothetical protein CIP107565_01732 [Corynebacterium diphtheriae]|nr:hypothetical protein CIP107565_01732 [Corynebacterium diphtheriae]